MSETKEAVKSQKPRLSMESPFHEYPDACTLLISATRKRAFLERTARELLAGGTEAIVLSALGEAIGLCVGLALTLQDKKAAHMKKIMTARNSFVTRLCTPSIRILMLRDRDFKGSRTPPAYVQFSSIDGMDQEGIPFEAEPAVRTATVIAGDASFSLSAPGIDPKVSQVLEASGISIPELEKLFEECYAHAISSDATNKEGLQRAKIYENPSSIHPHVRAAICRLGFSEGNSKTGSVVICTFQNKWPRNSPQNAMLVYLVSPNPSEYAKHADQYVAAVEKTASNLMTALCDYNGFSQREGPRLRLKRIVVCRIPTFYQQEMHSHINPERVARAIVQGMDAGYCHGPSPGVFYIDPYQMFRRAWTEVTGLAPVEIATGNKRQST